MRDEDFVALVALLIWLAYFTAVTVLLWILVVAVWDYDVLSGLRWASIMTVDCMAIGWYGTGGAWFGGPEQD